MRDGDLQNFMRVTCLVYVSYADLWNTKNQHIVASGNYVNLKLGPEELLSWILELGRVTTVHSADWSLKLENSGLLNTHYDQIQNAENQNLKVDAISRSWHTDYFHNLQTSM